MIECLTFSGLPLTQAVLDLLFYTGWGMYSEGKQVAQIRQDNCEGRITSDFAYATLGSFFGIRFTADIEVEAGKTHVEFLIRSCDLVKEHFAGRFRQAEKAAWN
jgi:hypothetical protein